MGLSLYGRRQKGGNGTASPRLNRNGSDSCDSAPTIAERLQGRNRRSPSQPFSHVLIFVFLVLL